MTFSSGEHGEDEAGEYAFWVAVLKRKVKLDSTYRMQIFGRAKVGLDAGDRFSRMAQEQRFAKSKADRQVYRKFWNDLMKRGANVQHIRPAMYQEIKVWLDSHKKDSPYIKSIRIEGKEMLGIMARLRMWFGY